MRRNKKRKETKNEKFRNLINKKEKNLQNFRTETHFFLFVDYLTNLGIQADDADEIFNAMKR